jgi:hypothetical protein
MWRCKVVATKKVVPGMLGAGKFSIAVLSFSKAMANRVNLRKCSKIK